MLDSPSLPRRLFSAARAGVGAFRQTFDVAAIGGQASAGRGPFEGRVGYYALLWYWYKNEAFENLGNPVVWERYRTQFRLYKQTRTIYNPVRRLVDFYASQVYPGVLAIDGAKLPDGVPLAIPLAEDTSRQLKVAIGQYWQWANWQSGKSVMVRYGACTGDVLVEIIDEVEKGKVTRNIVWPGLVKEIQLDAGGNVKGYTLEYTSRDEQGERYLYTKIVDGKQIRTFKDEEPWGYDGVEAVRDNPYGFVPAVWIKHTDLGGDFGAPAIKGIAKLDQLNSLASHLHDSMHKQVANPVVLWADGPVGHLFGRKRQADQPEMELPENNDRDSVLMLKGPGGGRVDSLLGNLDPGSALPWIQSLLDEVNADYPELSMFQQLREMNQITGPAASRLMGDVASALVEAQAGYDLQTIKLLQMAVAIAGWRANSGAWGKKSDLTRQQAKFLPFDLDSYANGDLDFEIEPRPLVPMTALERLEMERARLELEADKRGVATALQAGRAAAAPGGVNPLNEKASSAQAALAAAAQQPSTNQSGQDAPATATGTET